VKRSYSDAWEERRLFFLPPDWPSRYLQLLLCEQRQGAAHGGICDGSRLYPAPDLGRWAHPPPLKGVGLLWLVQPKNKRANASMVEPMPVRFHR